jgi:hypothetical protein
MNKQASFLIAILCINSCTGFSVYKATYNAAKAEIVPNRYSAITENYFSEQKYSFAIVKFGNADSVTMVLQSIEDDIYKWVSSDGKIIFTNKAGRIIQTKGLSHDVHYLPLANKDLLGIESLIKLDYLVNFYNPELTKIKGADLYELEDLPIKYDYFLSNEIMAKKIKFLTTVPLIKWSAEGYMLTSKGRAIASSQTIHPHFPNIEMYFYFKL